MLRALISVWWWWQQALVQQQLERMTIRKICIIHEHKSRIFHSSSFCLEASQKFQTAGTEMITSLWARNYFFTALGLKNLYFILEHDEILQYNYIITELRRIFNLPACQTEHRSLLPSPTTVLLQHTWPEVQSVLKEIHCRMHELLVEGSICTGYHRPVQSSTTF